MRIRPNHIKLVWTNSHSLCSHFLVTESELILIMDYTNYILYVCGNMKIYAIQDAIMDLNYIIASLFLFQSFMWGNDRTSFVLNYMYYSRDDDNDCPPRTPHVQSFITQNVTDKAAYLNKVTLPYHSFLHPIDHAWIYSTALFLSLLLVSSCHRSRMEM